MGLLTTSILISGVIVNLVNMYQYTKMKKRIVTLHHRAITTQARFCDEMSERIRSGQPTAITVIQLKAFREELINMEKSLLSLKKGKGKKK